MSAAIDSDVMVAVLNCNQEDAELMFDGKTYVFPGKNNSKHSAVTISIEAALFMFAVQFDGEKLIRDKKISSGVANEDSYYKLACLRYGCWGNPEGFAWFDNFKFKIAEHSRLLSAEQFGKL